MEVSQMKELYKRLVAPDRQPHRQLLADNPTLWLQENMDSVDDIAAQNPKLKSTLPLDFLLLDALFPRCYLYVSSCALSDPRKANILKVLVDIHTADWPHLTLIERLASFKSISGHLRLSAYPGIPADLSMGRTGVSATYQWPESARLVELDMCHVGALVLEVIADEKEKEAFFGPKASPQTDQNLVDLLQELLDCPNLHCVHGVFLRALLKLSKRTGMFPTSLCHKSIGDMSTFSAATGGFADVYKGSLNSQVVAVKMIRTVAGMSRLQLIKKLNKEAILWSNVHHPNILPFYGIYLPPSGEGSERICLLSPWMANGNLKEYIQSKPELNLEPLIQDVAKGLDYLHRFQPSIVHGDLKGDNIFITPSGRACLADFGLSCLVQDKQWSMTTSSILGGVFLYFAPELLDETSGEMVRKSPATDIYAFGCLCYEVYAGSARFSNIPSPMGQLRAILKNALCLKPAHMKESVWLKVQECWVINPEDRPSSSDFFDSLDECSNLELNSAMHDPYTWEGSIKSRIQQPLHTQERPIPVPPAPGSGTAMYELRGIDGKFKGFACPLFSCRGLFKRMNDLKRHLRTHTTARPFTCHLCKRIFSKSDYLTQHLQTHRASSGPVPTSSASNDVSGETDAGQDNNNGEWWDNMIDGREGSVGHSGEHSGGRLAKSRTRRNPSRDPGTTLRRMAAISPNRVHPSQRARSTSRRAFGDTESSERLTGSMAVYQSFPSPPSPAMRTMFDQTPQQASQQQHGSDPTLRPNSAYNYQTLISLTQTTPMAYEYSNYGSPPSALSQESIQPWSANGSDYTSGWQDQILFTNPSSYGSLDGGWRV